MSLTKFIKPAEKLATPLNQQCVLSSMKLYQDGIIVLFQQVVENGQVI